MSPATHHEPVGSPLASLIEQRARERGDATFLREARGEASLSYAQAVARAGAWRERLADAGVPAGARVALSVADPLTFADAFLGVLAAGAWVVPFDPTMEVGHEEAFRERARRTGAAWLVSEASERSAPGVSLRPLEHAASSDTRTAGAAGGVVMASSGTTGTPKIMGLRSEQLLATAGLVADHNALGAQDHGLNPLPLFHINAQVVGLLATLHAGATLSLDDRFHRTEFWSRVERLGVTWINAVPAIISRLLPLRDGEVVPPRVRFVRSASAPLAATLMREFEAETGLAVVESYGMTEAASQICANPLDGARRAGSVGRAVGVDLRVTSESGGPAGVGEVGSVEIHGATVIQRYEGPGYEDRFSDDGWLRTGDNGYLDANGYLFLVGRSDDVINRGGEKIFPREIEEVLVRVPEVLAAAVVGVPDAVFGQVPIAYVQLAGVGPASDPESLRPLLKELREVLLSTLGRSRRPAALHVVAALPAGATGKILKGSLRADPPAALFSETVG